MGKSKDQIEKKAFAQMAVAWDECEARFNQAIKDHGDTGKLVFTIGIDKSVRPYQVITRLAFKEVERDGELKVAKTVSYEVGGEAEDEDQMPLGTIQEATSPATRLFDPPQGQAEAEEDGFKEGNEVRWGNKTGKVVEVVVENESPSGGMQEEIDYSGKPRKHQSYIVEVAAKKEGGKPSYFWPVVSKLSRA